MTLDSTSRLPEMLKTREAELLAGWLAEQTNDNGGRNALIPETERREQSREFLNLLREGAQRSASIADLTDINAPQWSRLRDMLTGISRTRALQGFTPTEIATFVFSLKIAATFEHAILLSHLLFLVDNNFRR